MTHIAVVGVGGVGGFFGGMLTQLMDPDDTIKVYFIARHQHLHEIRAHGLVLETDEGRKVCRPTRATDDIASLPPLDGCILAVKSYDLPPVLQQLRSKVTQATMILPLLNGVDIYDRVVQILGRAAVFPACAYVGTRIERPGVVRQRGGSCAIHLGPDPRQDYIDGAALCGWLDQAHIRYHWSRDVQVAIWSKYIFIAAFGLVTARFGITLGQVTASEQYTRLTQGIMAEITAIACRRNIALPRSIVADSLNKATGFPFDTKTSFQRDYENPDRPDERDLFGGTILRMGKETGVPTPLTARVFEAL